MTNGGKNSRVDEFIGALKQWQAEFEALRAIVLDCHLDETLKWGKPCYTFERNNVVLIHVFKEYCALLFFKGALLRDEKGILIQQTENVQAARQIRFTGVRDIADCESTLKAYIQEAIEVEKAGLQVEMKQAAEPEAPDEWRKKLTEDPALKAAFEALTPGRQRGYIYYFAEPKQSKTREARIEKCASRILAGQGIHD